MVDDTLLPVGAVFLHRKHTISALTGGLQPSTASVKSLGCHFGRDPETDMVPSPPTFSLLTFSFFVVASE